MPITISLRRTKAIEIPMKGTPCTKLLVPSIGSITHVGKSVKPAFACDSSATNL